MQPVWLTLRGELSILKKALLNRPLGLRGIGAASSFVRPWTIRGAENVLVGKRSVIMEGAHIEAIDRWASLSFKPSITIGDDVYIGRHCFMTAIQGIVIGNGSVFGDHVYLGDSAHGTDPMRGPIMRQELESKGPIIIGTNCFLGYRTAVTSGVTLGDWCVVGANTVVTRSFPSYSMIAGCPAKLIKRYNTEDRCWIDAR